MRERSRRSRVPGRMRPLPSAALVLLLLGACGGATPASATQAPSGEPPPGPWRADLECYDTEPTGEPACAARGCRWIAPLVCGGIEQPEERMARAQRCVCVCAEEMGACMRAP